MTKMRMVHPIPWNEEKGVGVGIDFGHVKGYPGGYHFGIDFYGGDEGDADILASGPGVVVETDDIDDSAYGLNITIKHADDLYSVYAHLYEIFVEVGQEVEAGECIGSCGTSGNSSGVHLHYEIREGGDSKSHCVDPMEWIDPKPSYYAKAKMRWK